MKNAIPVKFWRKQSAAETYFMLECKTYLSTLYSVHDSLCTLILCQKIRDFNFIIFIIYAIQLPTLPSQPQEEFKPKVLRQSSQKHFRHFGT